MFMYVCKGHERLETHLTANNEQAYDEAQDYQDIRYIEVPEPVQKGLST